MVHLQCTLDEDNDDDSELDVAGEDGNVVDIGSVVTIEVGKISVWISSCASSKATDGQQHNEDSDLDEVEADEGDEGEGGSDAGATIVISDLTFVDGNISVCSSNCKGEEMQRLHGGLISTIVVNRQD